MKITNRWPRWFRVMARTLTDEFSDIVLLTAIAGGIVTLVGIGTSVPFLIVFGLLVNVIFSVWFFIERRRQRNT